MRFNEKELAVLACTCVPDMEGLLDKKGKGNAGYKPRWFRLKGNLLFYFKASDLGWDSIGNDPPVGVILLERCRVERSPSDIRPFCFSLRFEDEESRYYAFAASSENEMHRWIDAIRAASYESLRKMLYQLQNEITMLTGQDPLNVKGLSHQSVKKKKAVNFVTQRVPRGSQKHLNRMSQFGGSFASSLDKPHHPQYELSLSCSSLPLNEGAQPPNSFIRTNLLRMPRGAQAPLGLSHTEVIECTCDPIFFTLVMLDISRVPRSSLLQFELFHVPRSLLSSATDDQPSIEGSKEEETDQYAQAKLIGTASCTINNLTETTNQETLKLLMSIGNSDTVIPCTINVTMTKVENVLTEVTGAAGGCLVSKGQRRNSQISQLPSPLKNNYNVHFRIPCRDGGTLKVIEEMGESVFNIQVPLELVKCYCREDMEWYRELSALGILSEPWNSHLITAQAMMLEAIGFFQASIEDLQSFIIDGVHGFKRSTYRKDHTLSLLASNLHIQTLRVQPAPNVRERVYHTVTLGCPADHSAGFRNGGLKKMLQEARSCATFINSTEGSKASTIKQALASLQQTMQNTAGYRDLLLKFTGNANSDGMNNALQGISSEVQQLLWQMQTEVVMEAIKELRVARLPQGTNYGSFSQGMSLNELPMSLLSGPSNWVWDGTEFLQFSTKFSLTKTSECVQKFLINLLNVVEVAALCIVEQQHEAVAAGGVTSYKPTYCWTHELIPVLSKLYQTLDGLFTVAKTSLIFSLLQLDCRVQGLKVMRRRRDIVFSQALTGLVTSFYLSLCQHLSDSEFLEQISKIGFLVQFSSLLSCVGDEQSMLEDMLVVVGELQTVSFQLFENSTFEGNSLHIQISGKRDDLIVQFLMPSQLMQLVTHDGVKNGQLIRVVPIMFSQGVHDLQVLSNLQFQENMNAKGFKLLYQYIADYEKLTSVSGARVELEQIEQQYTSQKAKNVEFINSIENLCRGLNCGRLTSCKSAKDRTSMAVTLEETTHLINNHGVLPNQLTSILATLRSKGTRLHNCFKNTEHYRYAFNPISYRLLPKLYQPPSHTCSGAIQDVDILEL